MERSLDINDKSFGNRGRFAPPLRLFFFKNRDMFGAPSKLARLSIWSRFGSGSVLIEVGQRNAQHFFSPTYFLSGIEAKVDLRNLKLCMFTQHRAFPHFKQFNDSQTKTPNPRHMIQSQETYFIVFGSRAFV